MAGRRWARQQDLAKGGSYVVEMGMGVFNKEERVNEEGRSDVWGGGSRQDGGEETG